MPLTNNPDPATVQQILEARAKALARPPEAAVTGEFYDLLVLVLGAERYGGDIQYIQEVQPAGRLTPVPGAPPVWAGLVNVRGQLYPVLHLQRYLGRHLSAPVAKNRGRAQAPQKASKPGGKIVLVSVAGLQVALLCDDVLEVRQIPHGAIQPALSESSQPGQPVVKGITADLLTVLDLEMLLTDPDLVVQTDVSQASP